MTPDDVRPDNVRPDNVRPDEVKPDDVTAGDGPPSWAGAPGFVAYTDHLPPHAPMPGAPPYPANIEHPLPPIGAVPARTALPKVLAAAAVWAVLNAGIVLVVGLPVTVRVAAGLVLTVATAAGAVWLAARQRGWRFPVLLLVTAPVFWLLRAATANLVG